MAGAWKGGMALSNASSIGAVSASSTGTTITGSASTFTKGAYAQLIASTAADISWLFVAATSSGSCAVDIAVGAAASEIVVLSNLSFATSGGASYLLPITIPAGSRIAARFSSSLGGTSIVVVANGFGDTYQSVGTGSSVDTYGLITTTNLGTAVDPGATPNTKGAYVTIATATTNDYSGLVFTLDPQNISTGSVGNVRWLFDLAVGAAGSEVVIIPNVFQGGFSFSGNLTSLFVPSQYHYAIQIPTGTRIAARCQCSTGTSPDRILGMSLYGFRQ